MHTVSVSFSRSLSLMHNVSVSLTHTVFVPFSHAHCLCLFLAIAPPSVSLAGSILAFMRGLHVIGAVLSCSALSSMLYHLCDTDFMCVGGLSFRSLQASRGQAVTRPWPCPV